MLVQSENGTRFIQGTGMEKNDPGKCCLCLLYCSTSYGLWLSHRRVPAPVFELSVHFTSWPWRPCNSNPDSISLSIDN